MENPTLDFDVNLFKQRLTKTILWCRYKIAQAITPAPEILWSLADQSLARSDLQWGDFHLPDEFYLRNNQSLIEYADKVFAQRSQLVATLPTQPNAASGDVLMGGRLVVFLVDTALFHGVSGLESKGFFDGGDVPACDTWVYLYHKDHSFHLLSWVPPEFIENVEMGIEVNPEECVRWLDKMMGFPPYRSQLEAIGIAFNQSP